MREPSSCFCVANITPSFVRTPMAEPVFLIASRAPSTYSSLPSLENALILLSNLWA